jgi:hypothetical protein
MTGHTNWRDLKHKGKPKQTTAKGLEIPLPKRSEVMDFFRKVTKPKK